VDTTVPFTLGGTAANGTDYRNVTATPLVIKAGQISGTITGTLIDDGAPDGVRIADIIGDPGGAFFNKTTS
jgi:hypothetical protein